MYRGQSVSRAPNWAARRSVCVLTGFHSRIAPQDNLSFSSWRGNGTGSLAERNLPMKWLTASLVTVLCLAGCHAPKPSFNVLAPYGPTRVPPPSTSGQAPNSTYYNGTTPPTTNVPVVPRNSGMRNTSQKKWANTPSHNLNLASQDSWRPVRTKSTADPAPVFKEAASQADENQVLPVSYSGTGKTEEAKMAVAISSSSEMRTAADGQSVLRLNGMPVTDATTGKSLPEPARFVPPKDIIEISQLPPASNASSPDGTVVSSSKASDHIKSTAADTATSKTTLRWRARTPGK
jgi:hypothetical protein